MLGAQSWPPFPGAPSSFLHSPSRGTWLSRTATFSCTSPPIPGQPHSWPGPPPQWWTRQPHLQWQTGRPVFPRPALWGCQASNHWTKILSIFPNELLNAHLDLLATLLEEDLGVSFLLLPEASRFPCSGAGERSPRSFLTAFVHRDDDGPLSCILLFGFPLGLGLCGLLRQPFILGWPCWSSPRTVMRCSPRITGWPFHNSCLYQRGSGTRSCLSFQATGRSQRGTLIAATGGPLQGVEKDCLQNNRLKYNQQAYPRVRGSKITWCDANRCWPSFQVIMELFCFKDRLVPLDTTRKRWKSVTMRNPHDDPLNDVGTRQYTNVHERRASGIDAFEWKRRSAPSTTTFAKSGMLSHQIFDDRVVDKRWKSICDVKRQEASPSVDDVVWSAADWIFSFDSFKRLPEAVFPTDNDIVLVSVDGSLAHIHLVPNMDLRDAFSHQIFANDQRDFQKRFSFRLFTSRP